MLVTSIVWVTPVSSGSLASTNSLVLAFRILATSASGFPSRKASVIVRAKIRLRRQVSSLARQAAMVILQRQLQPFVFISLSATVFWASDIPDQSTSLRRDGSVWGPCDWPNEAAWTIRKAAIPAATVRNGLGCMEG